MQQQGEGQPSGPPPPYPDDPNPPPPKTPLAAPVKRKLVRQDSDLKACSNWHTLLVSVADDTSVAPPRDSKQQEPANPPPRSVLHFWSPSSAPSKSSTYVPTQLTEENLRYIQGFQDLGAFAFPLPLGASPAEIHDYLTSLSADPGPGEDGADSEDDSEDAVETIGAQLALLPPSADGPRWRMFTVSALSDSPDALFASGDAPAWKWAKPNTVYGRKSGSWAVEPAVAVENAAWEAGRDIMLLVRGFYEEHRAWMLENPVFRLLKKGEVRPRIVGAGETAWEDEEVSEHA
ncbi:hypothetical protein B0T11DRAFT_2914 [Plectosphaerella cucumerina]|uniref:Uncharacterized protein n=1 Tax=Plectosphaerella cucumerina TaxID=40658 RepID=A0A8K0X7D1_9PEZI|nr:hypothetical protein B0T11DRAFT_2914 [Plectosphaerella cucumerina]